MSLRPKDMSEAKRLILQLEGEVLELKAQIVDDELIFATSIRFYLKGVSELNQEISELKAQLVDHYQVLSDISSMCIGEIAMSYTLDATGIGQMIYELTGLNSPELEKYADNLRKGEIT